MKNLLWLAFLPLGAFCQNTIGLPDMLNYSKQSYGAGLQNWDMQQDKNGLLYVANNEGLLTFDGKNWSLYPLPNKTIVRSVKIGTDARIYVGGQDELGYFAPASNGLLQYHSLSQYIPAKDKLFGDVWNIVAFNKNVFFRSSNKVFKFTNESVAVFNAPSEWSYLGLCDGRLLAHDFEKGIMEFKNETWSPINAITPLPINDPVTSLLAAPNHKVLITTLKNGLFVLNQSTITKIKSANDALFASERIYTAARINDQTIVLASSNKGIFIADFNGNILQRFSGQEGLQNNNVLSVFLDHQSNIWLGLNNGIDMIAYNSAIKQINPLAQNGAGYNALIHHNQLFVGTSNGLYSIGVAPLQDQSFNTGSFVAVNNTKGQTWGLTEINNELLMGHHEGAFVIKNNTAIPIASTKGFWNFVPTSSTFPSPQVVAGTYRGLMFFSFTNGQFVPTTTLAGFTESSRFVAMDNEDNFWVSHPYHGVFKIYKNAAAVYQTQSFGQKNGLPTDLNNHVYKIKNEVVVATEKGVYGYNKTSARFEPLSFYKNILGTQSIRYLKEDAVGNIWFIHEKTLGIIDLSQKNASVIYLPELTNKLLSGFEFIYAVDKNNVFVGAEKGFIHINYEKYKQTAPPLQVQVRSVKITSTRDSLLFGGYFSDLNNNQIQGAKQVPAINHDWKTIQFQFSTAVFGYQANLEYSYRLKGFEENWSEWTKRTEKEFTNLPEGNYSFEVKVKNNLGQQSAIACYSFKVSPPWYWSIWAKMFYLLLFSALIYGLYKWQEIRFKAQEAKYDEEQKKLQYIHELELSKTEVELVALNNEKLEAEINFKNAELASSAMHLVKKGELITKIKGELAQVMKGFDHPQATADLKKMVKVLNEEDNIDQEWEQFSKHFDKVHSDFLVVLKEKHPSISSNELKLCAYLRMNLSTKEIAQLMNISPRGVEISRYRLRKKIQIPTEENLFNYLINLHS